MGTFAPSYFFHSRKHSPPENCRSCTIQYRPRLTSANLSSRLDRAVATYDRWPELISTLLKPPIARGVLARSDLRVLKCYI